MTREFRGFGGIWPFQRRPEVLEAEKLLAAVTGASRDPFLFGPGGAPDTLEGRFEVLTLHAALVLMRLRSEPTGGKLAQCFADALFSQLDAGLREAGVGDLTVPKRMHRLAGDFYGRLAAYEEALVTGDPATLAAAVERNISGLAPAAAAGLSARITALAKAQSTLHVAALADRTTWAPALG